MYMYVDRHAGMHVPFQVLSELTSLDSLQADRSDVAFLLLPLICAADIDSVYVIPKL